MSWKLGQPSGRPAACSGPNAGSSPRCRTRCPGRPRRVGAGATVRSRDQPGPAGTGCRRLSGHPRSRPCAPRAAVLRCASVLPPSQPLRAPSFAVTSRLCVHSVSWYPGPQQATFHCSTTHRHHPAGPGFGEMWRATDIHETIARHQDHSPSGRCHRGQSPVPPGPEDRHGGDAQRRPTGTAPRAPGRSRPDGQTGSAGASRQRTTLSSASLPSASSNRSRLAGETGLLRPRASSLRSPTSSVNSRARKGTHEYRRLRV